MPEFVFRTPTLDDAESISKLIIASQRQYCFYEYTVMARS
jgi:hypothetical protein